VYVSRGHAKDSPAVREMRECGQPIADLEVSASSFSVIGRTLSIAAMNNCE
jgi:hypothetical protein